MSPSQENEQALQRAYYARTADTYDSRHIGSIDEHKFALAWLRGFIELAGVRSILDIGSGTGRALLHLHEALPDVRIVGVEPSPELREQGYSKGVPPEMLIDGDARKLAYDDGAFDLVTEFGALHHIPAPRQAVMEMLRVAHIGIFISDSNKFGQGSPLARLAKRVIGGTGLWPAFNYVRTRGKGYMISEGDGLFYSYSVFDDYPAIRAACKSVHVLNTRPAGIDPKASASHVALLGLKTPLMAG